MQAGLGGGSSDAAAALRALGRSGASRDAKRARTRRAALGADVPYFLEGGTALGLERGDLLFPLIDIAARRGSSSSLPAFGVSTKEAFGWWDRAAGKALPAASRRQDGPDGVQRSGGAWSPRVIPRSAVSSRHSGGRRVPRGDVGQRLGGFRPVFRRVAARDRAARRARPVRAARLVTRTLEPARRATKLAAT